MIDPATPGADHSRPTRESAAEPRDTVRKSLSPASKMISLAKHPANHQMTANSEAG